LHLRFKNERKQRHKNVDMLFSAGADPGFQVGGGAHSKNLRRAEGGAIIFGVFRVKNHDFTPTNLIFSPGSAPVLHTTRVWIYTSAATLNMKRLQG
jgi:hypothetical protein